MNARKKVDDYVSEWYKIRTAKSAYTYKLQPVNGVKLWPKTSCEPLLPPLARRMPGRPKQARNKEAAEGGSGSKKSSHTIRVSRVGRTMKCTICGLEGHNSRSCKSKAQKGNKRVAPNECEVQSQTVEVLLCIVLCEFLTIV